MPTFRSFLIFLTLCPSAIFAQGAGFGGPAVAGRSLGAAVGRRSAQVKFRPFISVRGVYDSGLSAAQLTPEGVLAGPVGTAGIEATGGIYGAKSWRQVQLFGSYIGGYRQYRGTTGFDGSDHSGTLGINYTPGRRISITSTATGGTLIRAFGPGFGFQTPFQTSDPVFDPVPVGELFDLRITFASNSNTFAYNINPRTSVAATGGTFITRRAGLLVNSAGVSGGGDFTRRLNRRSTITASYNYNRFSFDRQFGFSGVQEVSLALSQGLGRQWTLQLRAGGFRVESEGIEQVQLDPVIAEILGQQVGTRAFYRLNYFPSLRVALLGRFRKSNAGFSYQRLIRPGNGIILTARTENWNTYYSYTGVRKWTFTGSYSYYNLTGVLRFQQSNAIHLAGIRAGYQIRPRLQALFGVEGRIVQINTPNQFLRDGARPTFGFSYSPGEIPLALW